MKLAVVFLNKIEYLEDILSAYLEIGVSGASVIDSEGMGHIISHNIPIFAGLRDAFAGSSPGNKIILSVVEDKMIDKIAEVIEDICPDTGEFSSGLLISVSVDKLYSIKQI